MIDKEVRNYIDNDYFELKDNQERYGIEELHNFYIKEGEGVTYIIITEYGKLLDDVDLDCGEYSLKEDEGGKYIIIDEDGVFLDNVILDCGDNLFKEYLKDEPQKPITLQDITKRNIIKNTWETKEKMKLLKPRVYDNVRSFYLTVES